MRRMFPALALLLLGLMLIGAVWQPHDPDAIDLSLRFAPPSLYHWLGTDQLGRDVLARLMIGGWRTAVVLGCVAAIGMIGGTVFGVAAAMLEGWRGALILRAGEMFIVVPTLVVALTAAAVFGLNPVTAGVAMGLAGIGPYTLFAHALARRLLAEPFVHAARAMGVGGSGLVVRHVVPNMAPVLFAHIGANAGLAVTAYAALAFLGLGADPSRPDWGAMLFEYRMFLFDHPLLMVWPGLAIAMVSATLNAVFDAH
jgi:peptide/nickel transport system permease protein